MREILVVIAVGIAGLAFQVMAVPPTTTTFTAVTSVTNSPPTVGSQLQSQVATLNASTTKPSSATVTPPNKWHWFPAGTSNNASETHWYGQDSSRAWTEECGWHPGQTAFPDGEHNQSQLVVLQVDW
ncbi:MAG TPA: hypothetical protein VGN23_06615 [Verrucomicrobiae bacterium]